MIWETHDNSGLKYQQIEHFKAVFKKKPILWSKS